MEKNENDIDGILVILVSPCAPPIGGMTRWTELVTSSLKTRNDIQVVLVNSSLGVSAKERKGLQTVFGTFGCVMRGVAALLKCRKKPNCVLHVATSGGKGFIRDYLLCVAASFIGIPSCVHMHFGRIPTVLRSKSIESQLLDKVIKSSSAIATMDEGSKRALNSIGIQKVKNIPNPIALNEIDNFDGNKEKEIVYVGHVYKEKGIEVLLKAWNLFWPENPCWKLEIIGSCERGYQEQLQAIVSGMNVVFDGELDHESTISKIMRSRILVLPSYSEGFPNVVLEAMACNTVVIGTEVGAIPEMLDYDERLLIPTGDSVALAAAISAITRDETTMIDMARTLNDRVNELYSSDVVVNELRALWLSLSQKEEVFVD